MFKKLFSLLLFIFFNTYYDLVSQNLCDGSFGNTAPVLTDENINLDEGELNFGNLLINDDDADNDVLSIYSYTLPLHGVLFLNQVTGVYTYQHDGSEEFSDSFEYVVTDQKCYVTASVTININPVNDPPIVVQDTFYVNEGDTLDIKLSDPNIILNNDIDPDNPVSDLEAVLAIAPQFHDISSGIFDLKPSGEFLYIHGCNDDSLDVFQYRVSDGLDQSLIYDSVLIFIMNEPPIGHPDTFSVNFNDVLTIDNELDGLLKNDVDSFYCDVLSVEIVQEPSLHLGPFSLNPDGTFTYTHNGTFDKSQDTIIYRVYDGEDYASENDTVYINIILPPPNTATLSFAVDEGDELVVDSIQGILPNVTSNLGLPIISVELVSLINSGPFRGSLLPSGDIKEDGSFIYQHDCTDSPNEDYFLYKVRDSLTESIDTVKITVNNVCPIGTNDQYNLAEGGSINIPETLGVLLNDTDDNVCDQLTVTIVDQPLYASSFNLDSDGSFEYTHDDSENFVDQFSYRLSDGECNGAVYIVDIIVTPVDDKPPIANDDAFVPCIDEGGTLSFSTYEEGVLGNDIDPDLKDSVLIAILVEDVLHGNLNLNEDGTFTYVHDGGEDDFDSFQYLAFDGDFNSADTATVTICINQINDCPVAVDDYFYINEGVVLDSTVARNDTDEDIDTGDNNYRVVGPPIDGLELRTDGSFIYISPEQIPSPGPETVTFQYEITDNDPSTSCSTIANVTIQINSINDCPVAVDDTIIVDGLNNDIIIKDIIENDFDVDNPLDSSSVFIINQPHYGNLVVNDDGTITYDYTGSPSKRDSITYAVQDSVGCISNYAKVLINIENIQFAEYDLPTYFTPNSDRFNDFFTVKCKNITIENVRFEVKIVDRYQRIIYQGISNSDIIWDGLDKSTGGEASKGIYYYEITPIEYDNVRARTIVGVLFLDR